MKDSYNDVLVQQLAAVAATTADRQSNYIDLSGWDSALFIVNVSALTGVDGSNYLTPTLRSATATPASAGSYSAVAAGDIVGGFTKIDSTSEDEVTQSCSYTGADRYVQVFLDITGSSISAGYVGVVVVLSRSRKDPASAKTATPGTVS